MLSSSSSSPGLMTSLRQQRRLLAFLGVVLFFIFLWFTSKPWSLEDSKYTSSSTSNLPSKQFISKDFNPKVNIDKRWFAKTCLLLDDIDELKIENFSRLLKVLFDSNEPKCKEFSKLFQSIYKIRETLANVVINKVFAQKVLKWFGGNKKLLEETKEQHVLFITNTVTQESTVFNPLRAKRPGAGAVGPEVRQIVDDMISKSSKDCDFCNYKSMTARDPFGSIESKYCVTVSNTFKIEKFHGLILWKQHNPINYTEEQVVDLLEVAQQWFDKAHQQDSDFMYPHVYWDSLTKASASQIHPHVHLSLATDQYYSGWALLHESAISFSKSHDGLNYFTQIVKIHSALGLAVHLGEATAFAYLTPKGSHEVFLISKRASQDIFRLLFYTLRAFIDDMSLFATSLGMVFPKMASNPSKEDLPMMIQVIYRGSQASARSDISSFDLFGTHNVNVDPYTVIKSIRRTMHKYGVI